MQKDQRIIFNVVNLSKIKSLFQRGMTPVVKSTSRPKWQRLPSSQVCLIWLFINQKSILCPPTGVLLPLSRALQPLRPIHGLRFRHRRARREVLLRAVFPLFIQQVIWRSLARIVSIHLHFDYRCLAMVKDLEARRGQHMETEVFAKSVVRGKLAQNVARLISTVLFAAKPRCDEDHDTQTGDRTRSARRG